MTKFLYILGDVVSVTSLLLFALQNYAAGIGEEEKGSTFSQTETHKTQGCCPGECSGAKLLILKHQNVQNTQK